MRVLGWLGLVFGVCILVTGTLLLVLVVLFADGGIDRGEITGAGVYLLIGLAITAVSQLVLRKNQKR